MKTPVKKKTFTKNGISSIKEKLGFKDIKQSLATSSAEKPLTWINMPDAYVDALHIPGFPWGYASVMTGWSNTGKSTLICCAMASCQNQGALPVMFDTEGNFDFSYAISCGLKANPVYGDVEREVIDEETGEVTIVTENGIVDYEGDFLYYDARTLAELYGDMDHSQGKRVSKKRKVAVLEDIAAAMNDILDMQDNGEINQPVCFFWDSVGSIGSFKSYTSKTGNNMFDAGAISQAFQTLLSNRIPASRKVGEKYTNALILVNKIWNDSMNSMGGVPSIELKGGKSIYYQARLIVHLGGVGKASIKKLTATSKGQTYQYGIVSKIKVNKNQLPEPFNLTYEGTICCVHNGLVSEGKLDEYKKTYGKELMNKLEASLGSNVQGLADGDIKFEESEEEDA